ncbi:SRPBCC family protein [Sinosporangium album]|uniref:SRPBCC family protein n=1 Tax=Sinosporangium album TaxID=504805 RepID=UPI000B8787E6|nr:carbon monoxide dehydrogenase subunit G [Sinosporangium album]
MKVTGNALIRVDRDKVWAALQDPAVLVRTIPGCSKLEAMGQDAYRMTVSAGVASVKGVYQGEVVLASPEPPDRFVLKAKGQGAPGTVDATVNVRLSEADGGTRVDYDAEAIVGGMIGGVGQRMLTTVAKKTAGEFFSAVEGHLLAPAEEAVPVGAAVPEAAPEAASAVPVASTAEAAPGQVFERPAAIRPCATPTQVPPWTMLAAFGAGAGIALGSAAIGWLLGHGYRRK